MAGVHMDLDDLRVRVTEQNAKLDRVIRLNAAVVQELRFATTRLSLRWLMAGVVVELIVALVAVVWLGSFIVGHLNEPRFLVPAVLIDVCLIAFLGSCVRQLTMVAELDYGLPIVALQKTLGELRVLRIRTAKWVFVLSVVLWLPALAVLARGLAGVDLWMILGVIGEQHDRFFAWLVANVLFGWALALGAIWLSRRFSDRMDRWPTIKWLMDELAGQRLTKAQRSLDSIVEFETEPRS